MGFRIAPEDCTNPNFNILLCAFEPLNGMWTQFNQFLHLFLKEFKTVPNYRTAIIKFHDTLLDDLEQSSAYLYYEKTPTTELFVDIDNRLKANYLLDITKEFREERISKLKSIYEYVDPKTLPTNENFREHEEGFSWTHQYDFTKIDYSLNSFLLEHKELYTLDNANKYFVYVDLRSANFNVLKLVDPNLVLGANTWTELVNR